MQSLWQNRAAPDARHATLARRNRAAAHTHATCSGSAAHSGMRVEGCGRAVQPRGAPAGASPPGPHAVAAQEAPVCTILSNAYAVQPIAQHRIVELHSATMTSATHTANLIESQTKTPLWAPNGPPGMLGRPTLTHSRSSCCACVAMCGTRRALRATCRLPYLARHAYCTPRAACAQVPLQAALCLLAPQNCKVSSALLKTVVCSPAALPHQHRVTRPAAHVHHEFHNLYYSSPRATEIIILLFTSNR